MIIPVNPVIRSTAVFPKFSFFIIFNFELGTKNRGVVFIPYHWDSPDRFQQGLGEEHSAEHILPQQIEGGHGGGDPGVIRNFLRCCREDDFEGMEHSLQIAVEGHLLSFVAEEARQSGTVVDMEEFKNRVQQAKDERQPA